MVFTRLTMVEQQHSYHYSNKPPYAGRHVRWCERTVGEIIPHLLLDCRKVAINDDKPRRGDIILFIMR